MFAPPASALEKQQRTTQFENFNTLILIFIPNIEKWSRTTHFK